MVPPTLVSRSWQMVFGCLPYNPPICRSPAYILFSRGDLPISWLLLNLAMSPYSAPDFLLEALLHFLHRVPNCLILHVLMEVIVLSMLYNPRKPLYFLDYEVVIILAIF